MVLLELDQTCVSWGDSVAIVPISALLRVIRGRRGGFGAGFTLTASVLGFFMVTLDAAIVNIALPSIRDSLGGGMTGSQWVMDGYTLTFAALLLSTGALSDRVGARRALCAGLIVFAATSAACGLAPNLDTLIAARFAQGAAAAVLMPSSMALVSQAYENPARRARALAVWAMGAALAAPAGPLLGGVLTLVSWRLIFFMNVPAGAVALVLLARAAPSPRRPSPFDWAGQVTIVLAMGGLTYGVIEGGADGFAAPNVVTAFAVAGAALTAFLAIQPQGAHAHPALPLGLFRSRTVPVSAAVGFAFVVGYYGLPFVMSLYLQQLRGLSPLAAGVVFLPMALTSVFLTPFSPRAAERLGAPLLIVGGLSLMSFALVALAFVQLTAPVWVLAVLMVLVGQAGPTISPPMASVLLNAVPLHQAGTASGVFNVSRQVGGAVAVAVFGTLLGRHGAFLLGVRLSLLIAAVVAIAAAAACLRLNGAEPGGGAVLEELVPVEPVPAAAASEGA